MPSAIGINNSKILYHILHDTHLIVMSDFCDILT